MLQNSFLPDQIDLSLQGPAGSWKAGQDNRAASNGEGGVDSQEWYDEGYEGNIDDRLDEESDEEADPHRQHPPRCQIQLIVCNYCLMFLYRP